MKNQKLYCLFTGTVLYALLLTGRTKAITFNNSNKDSKSISYMFEYKIKTLPAETIDTNTQPKLSDSKVNTIIVNGKIFKLPCYVSELTAAGLTLPKSDILKPNAMNIINFESKASNFIRAYIYNDTTSEQDYINCIVYGIDFDLGASYNELSPAISIAGLQYGITFDDMKETFGTPTESYVSELYSIYKYETKTYSLISSFKKNILIGMSLYNIS